MAPPKIIHIRESSRVCGHVQHAEVASEDANYDGQAARIGYQCYHRASSKPGDDGAPNMIIIGLRLPKSLVIACLDGGESFSISLGR